MLAGHRVAVLLSLSLAAALTSTGIAAVIVAPRSTSPSISGTSLPAQVHRNVVWYGAPQAAPRSLHIDSTSDNASSPDAFQISYQGGNFTLVYQRVVEGPVTNQYTLSVNGLLEWNDTSGDGNLGDGTVVASTPLGPGGFGRYPIQHTLTTTTDGVHVNSFLISGNKGEVALNLTIADGFVALPSGQILTPMEAKLTLVISHNMTLPDTRLSLDMGISTNQKVALDNQSWDDLNDFSTDDRAVNVTNDATSSASSAYFAWSNTANVNGQDGTVTPTGPLSNGTMPGYYDLYLTYPRPAASGLHLQIVHDPTIGVVSAAYLSGAPKGPLLPFQGDALLYGISLAGVAVLVAGTALLVSRRRRKAP